MLNEGVRELGERGDGIVGQVSVPLQSWALEAGTEALAHACLALLPRDGCSEHSLFVGGDVIRRISRAIVHLHVREGELLGHLDESDGVHKR